MAEEQKQFQGQQPDKNGKCLCKRCGKRLTQTNFYQFADGSKCDICKPCITAHIDNDYGRHKPANQTANNSYYEITSIFDRDLCQ